MGLPRGLCASLGRLWRAEHGSMTIHALFMFTTCCAIGAAGLDVTHFFATRTELQVAADVAAHAALYRRNQGATTPARARADAIAVAQFGMPKAIHGDVLEDTDIVFGTYDPEAETFSVNPDSRAAVMVTTGRTDAAGNPLSTFLFRIVGVDQVDVATSAIAMTYQPQCLTQGFTAEVRVDVQSNGGYYKGFCMHSNGHVELNQNNFFEDGTVVSMPDLDSLVIPNSGYAKNEGLERALREDWYSIRILDRIRAGADDPLDTAILTAGDDDRPDYLTGTNVVEIPGTGSNRSLTPASFTTGRVHRHTCTSSGQRITLEAGIYSQVVLLTNCEVQISGKVDLQNTVVYTTNTSATSVQVNSGGGGDTGLWLGKPDACATGGGAQIITRGGFKNSAKLTINGGQIIALGDVNFASQATGVGASIISDGAIDGSSNISMTGCATGMEDNFTAAYFRLAR